MMLLYFLYISSKSSIPVSAFTMILFQDASIIESIAVYLLDKTTLKPNWDKDYEGYDIK